MQHLSEILNARYGEEVTIIRRSGVSGGDINEAWILTLSNGEQVFLKTNRNKKQEFFTAEADGLKAIKETKTIGTIDVIGTGEENGSAFLVLNYVAGGRRIPDFWEVFGTELAEMHLADTSAFVPNGRFGFLSDNYIGATQQINTPKNTWIDFYRICRLEVQFEMAASYFDSSQKAGIVRFLDRLDTLLIEPEAPSLLHGDLWGGNFMTGNNGKAILIDPAVYVGHPEADLAMTELFGGFYDAFYRAYNARKPLQPGYPERRDLYHLYQLLNHLNLFGGSYYGSVMRILKHFV